MVGKKLKLIYGERCDTWFEGLPRIGIYAGYNTHEKAHIILVRNPHNYQDIIPLKCQTLKNGEKLSYLSYLDTVLTDSENKFANNLLEKAGT